MKKIARRQQQQQQQQQEQEQLGGTRRGPSRGGRQSNDDSEGENAANAESRRESYVLKNRWWNGMTKGFLISTQMARVPMAWMGYWGIPLCHVSSYSLWIPTYMVESRFDMGLHRLSWAASSSTLMVRQLVRRNRPLKMNVLTWSLSPVKTIILKSQCHSEY